MHAQHHKPIYILCPHIYMLMWQEQKPYSNKFAQDQKYIKRSIVYIHTFADGTSSALFLLISILKFQCPKLDCHLCLDF